MNYSKDSRNKNIPDAEQKNKKKMGKKRKITFFRVLFITLIIAVFAVCGAGLGVFIGIIKSAPDVSQLELKPTTDFTSFVYDDKGIEIDRISGKEDRIYVTLDKIPTYLQYAFVALEDERFYQHNGIDIRGIFRAIVKNLQNGKLSEGASTITQQLIKNNILDSEKKFTRKIQEQYLALKFEEIYDKDLILEYYLNTIPLGHGMNGVQAAANRYFGKDVSDLTLAESVVIACITQAPTRYSPILNPENNYEKSIVALSKMVEQGYITEEQKDVALKENPYVNVQQVHQKFVEASTHSYFVDAVVEEVISDLQTEKGMTATQANNLLYGGGIKIYTTLDTDMQAIVDRYMDDDSLYPTKSNELKLNYSVTVKKADGSTVNLGGEGIVKNRDGIEAFKQAKLADWGITDADSIEKEIVFEIPQPQAAFVVSDQSNGHVKALSGGRGDKYGDRTFNRATQALRQPGSCFKILAAYAPAIDLGLLSPGSVLVDEPYTITYPGGSYSPRNWRTNFKGPTSIREGIWDSMNVLAVKTIEMVGLNTAFDYLLNFGFTSLSPTTDKGYAMALGGLTKGVSPLELNAAYAAIANNGTYIKPILYTKVLDRDNNPLLVNTPTSHQVIKESTASMLTDMMEDVVKIGTGGRLKSTFSAMPVAGKTGTTNDDKDLMFAGYTPYYTATVWLGHDTPKKLVYDYSNHLDIWGKIMQEIHQDLPVKSFELTTSGFSPTTVCSASGKIATELCRQDPNYGLVTDYFFKGDQPTATCDVHVMVKICNESGKIATEFCPADAITSKVTVQTHTEDEDGNHVISPESLCDIHTTEDIPVVPEVPEIPEDLLPILPDGGITPLPDPDETLPPIDIPEPPVIIPNPDDINDFFVPQG